MDSVAALLKFWIKVIPIEQILFLKMPLNKGNILRNGNVDIFLLMSIFHSQERVSCILRSEKGLWYN